MENDDDPFLSREEQEKKAALFLKAYNWLENPIDRIEAAFQLFDLELQTAERACNLPRRPGVYVFYNDETINYVGKSRELAVRCTGHSRKNSNRIAFSETPEHLIALREIQLISVLHPQFNHESKELFVSFYSSNKAVSLLEPN
jgi:hypothetical protein